MHAVKFIVINRETFLYKRVLPLYNVLMNTIHKTPTMKDVAKKAGVALGTVSKVFNGLPVGEDYRRRVLEAAKELDYQVNTFARGLKTNQTRNVALLIPTLRHPFFAALADEITAALSRRDYRLTLMITNYDAEAEQKCFTMVRQNKVDGIIGLTYHPDLIIDEGIPFVTIDRHVNSNVPCVSSDNYGGGEIAAKKLHELGSRHLLFMRIGSDVYGEVNKREAGFVSYCQQHQITYDSIILSDQGSEDPFYDYLRRHMHDGRLDFDGIFCNSDLMASHLMDFFDSEGIRVPEDLQIVGFDGIKDYFTGRYTCSTIVQPVADMAEAAVSLVLNKDTTAQPALVSLPVHFAPAGTTRDA